MVFASFNVFRVLNFYFVLQISLSFNSLILKIHLNDELEREVKMLLIGHGVSF